MADELFPTIELPGSIEDEEDDEKYYPSAFFDSTTGDFKMDGNHDILTAEGREAYIQWCEKILSTERESCLAYTDDIGVEFEELYNAPNTAAMESDIIETITDALMVNQATEYVRDFKFDHRGDECIVSFVVKGYEWEEAPLKTRIYAN